MPSGARYGLGQEMWWMKSLRKSNSAGWSATLPPRDMVRKVEPWYALTRLMMCFFACLPRQFW
ncbi:hypothetical protein D3C81_2082770 [compost metagenome]